MKQIMGKINFRELPVASPLVVKYTPDITIEEIMHIICKKELTPIICKDSGLPEWTVGEARALATAIYNRIMKGE